MFGDEGERDRYDMESESLRGNEEGALSRRRGTTLFSILCERRKFRGLLDGEDVLGLRRRNGELSRDTETPGLENSAKEEQMKINTSIH